MDVEKPTEALSYVSAMAKKPQDINELHRKLGHVSEEAVRGTARFYDWTLKNKFKNCGDCTVGKSWQKNLNKDAHDRSETPGERIFIDTSSIKEKSFRNSKFWLLAIDDATNFCWSFFLKTKDETSKMMISLIKELRAKEDKLVKFIRCDNAGDNLSFQCDAKEEGLGLQFEFTARKTPQQNGRVERKFATLFGHVRSMLNNMKLVNKHQNMRNGLWAECAATATKIENIVASKDEPPAF